LLTGDAKLRNEFIDQGISVHGSLWVIQMMVEQKVIKAESGVVLLEKLKSVNDRLPLEEIDSLIKKYKQ